LIDLIEQSNVKVKSILRMDTDELNAKVEGILQPRRILISKPVLQQFSVSEVAAVFAHELGHIKTKTMQKTFLIRAVLIFVRLYLAKVIYGLLLPIYGFSSPEQIAAFPLLAFGWLILGVFFRSIHSLISRYFEKKADQYAISVVGESSVLSSLDKILATAQRQVLSPFFNFVCRSHPCPEERLHISRQ
jgi:STE24 endopeptidase